MCSRGVVKQNNISLQLTDGYGCSQCILHVVPADPDRVVSVYTMVNMASLAVTPSKIFGTLSTWKNRYQTTVATKIYHWSYLEIQTDSEILYHDHEYQCVDGHVPKWGSTIKSLSEHCPKSVTVLLYDLQCCQDVKHQHTNYYIITFSYSFSKWALFCGSYKRHKIL